MAEALYLPTSRKIYFAPALLLSLLAISAKSKVSLIAGLALASILASSYILAFDKKFHEEDEFDIEGVREFFAPEGEFKPFSGNSMFTILFIMIFFASVPISIILGFYSIQFLSGSRALIIYFLIFAQVSTIFTLIFSEMLSDKSKEEEVFHNVDMGIYRHPVAFLPFAWLNKKRKEIFSKG
jgi:Na+/melibiose symporter-like transporter